MKTIVMAAAFAAVAFSLAAAGAHAGRTPGQSPAEKPLPMLASASAPVSAKAQGPADAAYAEIEQAFGFVPGFMKAYPKHGISGVWALTRDVELSDQTELTPKMKALINIAVGAQIPCRYCVWVDTKTARDLGATDGEIAEAVAQAGLTRHWSAVLNGMQIDFDEFKAEFGGD